MCYLLASPRELIGREFFTGKAAAAPAGSTPRWYADVKGMSDAAKTDRAPYGNTGIFCIGADGEVPATSPENTFTSMTPVPPQKGVSSIALVAVVSGSVQHYFSGDSDYQVDDAAASWLAGTVPVAKLSSHGSLVSWPHKALDPRGALNTLQPQHFICSTGASSVNGLHPRWELLFLLDALVRTWLSTGDSPKDVTPFFHSTNYPVWFVEKDQKASTTALSFNFDAFQKDSTDNNAKALLNMLNEADSVTTAYLRSILADAKTTAVEKTRFVIDYLRNLWVTMSYSGPEQHPVPGATTETGSLVTPQTQLLAIVAKLTANSPTISYINGALKTVADTQSPPKRIKDLDPGGGGSWPILAQSYAPPPGTTARGKSFAAASTPRYDVAPQGVKLPAGIAAISEAVWQDKDDEVPSEDYVKLVQNLDKTDPIPDVSPITVFGTNQPTTWLVAKNAYPDLKPASEKTNIILLGDDDSGFVGNLVPGFIGVSGTTLDPKTDFWAWLMKAGMINTSIDLTMDTAGTTIAGISMTCSLFEQTPGKTPAEELPLKFDTKSAATQFGPLWPSDQNGCTIKDTGVVLVGLDGDNSANVITVKLDQVVEKFRMQSTSPKSKLKTFLDSVGSKTLDVTLVSKADGQAYRNALWCSASAGFYSFTLRLTWKAKLTDVFDKVSGYLNQYLGLDASSALSVVNDKLNGFALEAQLTGRYQPTISGGYHIVTESSFKFSTQISVKGNKLDISFTYGNTGDMEIYVKPDGGASVLSLVQILCNVKDPKDSGTGISNSQDNIPSDLSSDKNKLKLACIWLARADSRTTFGIGFVLNFGSTPAGITYSSAGIYEGALITTSRLTSSQKLLPSYDAGKDVSSLVDVCIFPSQDLPVQIRDIWWLY